MIERLKKWINDFVIKLRTPKHYYLDKIGADYGWLYTRPKSIYGFSSSETWSLDQAWYFWLYERLKCYLDLAGEIVNLEYYTFTIDGEEKTQKEWIEIMIEYLEIAIKNDLDWIGLSDEEVAKIKKVGIIWAEVVSAMWW